MPGEDPRTVAPGHRRVLAVDAAINLLLGITLVWLPSPMMAWLGLPPAGSRLYSTVLGGVLVGIGLALLLELFGRRGLGLDGAVVINICGAGLLVLWLVARRELLSTGAAAVLWGVAAAVLLIAVVELAMSPRPRHR